MPDRQSLHGAIRRSGLVEGLIGLGIGFAVIAIVMIILRFISRISGI